MNWILVLPLLAATPASWALFSNLFVTPKLLAVALLSTALWWDARPRPAPAALVPALALLAIAVASTLGAADPWTALMGHYRAPYYGLLAMLLTLLVYAGATRLELDDLPGPLLWAGAVLSAGAIWEVTHGVSLFGLELPIGPRATSLTGNPVFLGATLALCFLAAWHRARRLERDYGALLALALITAGLVAARAKGAGLAVCAGVWAYEIPGRRRWWGLALLVLGLWGHVALSTAPNQRERRELVKIAVAAAAERPLLGWGPDQYLLAYRRHRTLEYLAVLRHERMGQASAHQDLAQVVATLGLLGLAAYLWLLGTLARNTTDDFALATLVCLWVQAQVQPVPLELMAVVAGILGAAHGRKNG